MYIYICIYIYIYIYVYIYIHICINMQGLIPMGPGDHSPPPLSVEF